MAADMLKAKAAIAELRKWREGAELGLEAERAIADLCDTFEWLEESRAGVMKERGELRRNLSAIETINAQNAARADNWRDQCLAYEAQIKAFRDAAKDMH